MKKKLPIILLFIFGISLSVNILGINQLTNIFQTKKAAFKNNNVEPIIDTGLLAIRLEKLAAAILFRTGKYINSVVTQLQKHPPFDKYTTSFLKKISTLEKQIIKKLDYLYSERQIESARLFTKDYSRTPKQDSIKRLADYIKRNMPQKIERAEGKQKEKLDAITNPFEKLLEKSRSKESVEQELNKFIRSLITKYINKKIKLQDTAQNYNALIKALKTLGVHTTLPKKLTVKNILKYAYPEPKQ